VCLPCLAGHYSSSSGSTSCSKCKYPYQTVGDGHSRCDAFQIGANPLIVLFFLGIVLAVVTLTVFFGTFGSIRRMVKNSGNVPVVNRPKRFLISIYFFIHLLFPVFDLLSDLFYFSVTLFYSTKMFYIMATYFIFSSIICPIYMMFSRLVQYGAGPRFLYSQNRLIWLCFAKYKYTGHPMTRDGEYWNFAPHYYADTWKRVGGDYTYASTMRLVDLHHGRRLCMLASPDHSDLASAIGNFVVIIFYVALQIVSIPLYFATYILQVLFLFFWFFVGAFLLWTKVDAMGTVWTTWFYYWTWSNDFAAVFEDPNVFIDTEVLNSTMCTHCLLHSAPHFILQVINNTYIKQPWGLFALVSSGLSGYLIASGVYLYIYHRCCSSLGVLRSELKDVPQILSLGCKIWTLPPALKIRPRKIADVDDPEINFGIA